MRRALVLLLVALAAPAAAAPAKPTTVVTKPKPVPPPAAPVETPSFILAPPIPLASARPAGDAGQCKATCAKTLYFCNSGGDDDGCGARWAQCNASCSATYAAPRFGR